MWIWLKCLKCDLKNGERISKRYSNVVDVRVSVWVPVFDSEICDWLIGSKWLRSPSTRSDLRPSTKSDVRKACGGPWIICKHDIRTRWSVWVLSSRCHDFQYCLWQNSNLEVRGSTSRPLQGRLCRWVGVGVVAHRRGRERRSWNRWACGGGASAKPWGVYLADDEDMSHLLLLGKFEYTGGPIFKVVLEC